MNFFQEKLISPALKKEIYQRVFLRSETKEIRLYGLGGDDIFTLEGNVKKGILVRVIGGKGEDDITDKSFVKQAGHQTKIYDDKNNSFHPGKEAKPYISNDSGKGFTLDWLAPLGGPGYNVDDGF